VDVCPNCKGIWFDSGEIAGFIKNLTESEDISPQTPQLFKAREIQKPDMSKEKAKSCPKCTEKLEIFNYVYDSNVFLDKCPSCQGIWADRGEALEIAKRLKVDPEVSAIMKHMAKQDKMSESLQELGRVLRTPISPIVLFMPKIIIPLADDNPRQRTPVVTISIIFLCMLVFVGQLLFVSNPQSFVQKFGLVPANFFSIGLLSSMFLHGGILHLIGNMFFLWLFGDNVEDRFSRFNFLIFYLCCGLAASVLHSVVNMGSIIPAIGASGAVSGIMGAYLLFYPTARVKVLFIYKIIHVPAFFYIGLWILFQIIFGIAYTAAGVSGIAWFAHIGGFAFGSFIAYLKKRK